MKIRNNLKKVLKEKKISQREISEITKITESAICRYVNNNRIPTGINMLKIAKCLNLPIEDIWSIENV